MLSAIISLEIRNLASCVPIQEFRRRKRDIFIKMQTHLQAYLRPAELCYGRSHNYEFRCVLLTNW
jgi:hypothetical protein